MTKYQILYNLSSVILRLRKRKGVSQSEVCEAVNFRLSSYSYIESGNTDLKLSRLIALAEYHGMKPHELMFMIENGSVDLDLPFKAQVEAMLADNETLKKRISVLLSQQSVMA